jgi:hypothetical protein
MSKDTPKFTINYIKSIPLDLESLEKNNEYLPEEVEYEYNPFRITNLQNYVPIYSLFFDLSEKTYNKISLNHKFHFVNMNTVTDLENKTEHSREVFIKYSPLIDPFRYMSGKYKVSPKDIQVMPNPFNSTDAQPLEKISYHNNSSYTDAFFSFLSSKLMHQHNFVHGVDYYGSYLGVQQNFKVNISDDLDYLNSSEYFAENNNKLFKVAAHKEDEFMNFGSRGNKTKLVIEDLQTHNISVDQLDDEIDNIDSSKVTNENELVYEKEDSDNKSSSSSESDSSTSDDASSNDSVDKDESGSSASEDWETDEDDNNDETESGSSSYSEEESQYAYINNFPVQLICLEKCNGTLDELFVKDKINEETGAAVLMQIIMILIAYQKSFNFTHNDLHTNNIMYVNTEEKYLYYRYDKTTYRVPTYGKIFKIIDFGRSVYKFNGQLLFSDSFQTGNDAATQYNTEPYMNEKKKRVDPNYSFDLSRLGCSIYDFIIEDDSNVKRFDELQKTIHRWCLDDNDKNILYRRNGEERYPNFKLYKMIARSVHKHTPQEQLEFPYFKQFDVSKKKMDVNKIMDIDSLPVYV